MPPTRILVAPAASRFERVLAFHPVDPLSADGQRLSAIHRLPASWIFIGNGTTEIIQLLAEGKSNKEIADILDVTVKTVETHRSNLMRKLHLHSLADVIRYAIRNRLVEA